MSNLLPRQTIQQTESPGRFDFANLFIFEMANNHQGLVEHGVSIVRAMGEVARRRGIRAAVKLQFRELDSFIHPGYRENIGIKHIGRFLSTRLGEKEFSRLVTETREQGMMSMVTPFDEPSVDLLERLGADIIKVASSAAQDWPLLERVASSGKPVIASTGGLAIEEIDRLVSFFQHRGVLFALMHCVAVYPTPNSQLQLNQIEVLRNRYPGITIGFSTHEEPGNLNAIRVAYAKGARLFEKHVGIATDTITLNTYSATPEQADQWIDAWREAADACGSNPERVISQKEKDDLASLMRGVYLKRAAASGSPIASEDVFFAMPLLPGQLASSLWREGMVADRDYGAMRPVSTLLHHGRSASEKDVIYSVIHAVKGMLNEARIPLNHDIAVELSHHYGLGRFREIGCVIIECINREYCKKLIIQLPGQAHPMHYHKKKDETFQVLSGGIEVEVEGRIKVLAPGDTLWIPAGVWHGFSTQEGVIFEEISTTSFSDDSFYVDRAIMRMRREDRKTRLLNWGRHQFD